MFRGDYSLTAPIEIAHMRYFEISLYRVRAGHEGDWDTIVKMVKAAYEKIPNVHWAAFSLCMGGRHTYYSFLAHEVRRGNRQEFAKDKQFVAAMGEDGMRF